MTRQRSLGLVVRACPVWARGGLAGLYLALVAWLSLTASPPLALQFAGWDKIGHFLMYGGLGVLLRWALWKRAAQQAPAAAGVLAGIFAYGILMEVLQFLCTRGVRTFEWDDILADILGATVLWLAAGRLLRRIG